MSCATKNAIGFHICAQNCYSLSKTQQPEMEWEVVLVPFEVGVPQAEALLLFPLCSVLAGRAEAARGRSFLLLSFVFFSLTWLLQAGLQEAAFRNPKFASRQILQTPVCMEQPSSIPSPLTKNTNFKILRLREMAVLNSSLISNYESL